MPGWETIDKNENIAIRKLFNDGGILFAHGYEKLRKNCPERNNRVYWEDATKFDYSKGLSENNLPNKIDYLSCDIDPQEKTFIALKKVFQDGIEPKLITFETDKYREKIDYEKLAIDFLYPNN